MSLGFEARVLADSTPGRFSGGRLITVEMTYPRFVHAEHLRHRMFSFNVASSRAIPVEKIIEQVEGSPVVPIHWGQKQKGMQAFQEVGPEEAAEAKELVLRLRDEAVQTARRMLELGLHKQVVNRYLEPWMWCTVICTGNIRAWQHFWSLRCHPDAEPHIREIAYTTKFVIDHSPSEVLEDDGLHLPLVREDDLKEFRGDETSLCMISAGRCARVSYLTHEGVRDPKVDIELASKLIINRHFSPFEHQAKFDISAERYIRGNLGWPWVPFRKTLQGEYGGPQ